MKLIRTCLTGVLAAGFAMTALGTDRLFTYTYEPETMPKGAWEFEQWATARLGRNQAVKRENYRRFDFREEIEYGVTDNYTMSLYLNTKQESYRDPAAGRNFSKFSWKGLSLENKVLVLNPAEKPVGLSLYLEGGMSDTDAFLEQKIILGQRHGKWKWAANLIHETEWEHSYKDVLGELELSFGVARQVARRWHVGLEARNQYKLPNYARWDNMALYVGPVVSYHRDKWWAALTAMPQVYGFNFGQNPDRVNSLDLKGHERWNIRLLIGIHF